MPDRRGLRIGGCGAVELARRYGTPLYVYDEAGLRDTCASYRDEFQAAWPRVSVAYAAKAFAAVAMLRLAYEQGLGVDVVSLGELTLARRAGVPAEAVTFHGVAKTAEELATAVRVGVGHIVIDSADEVDDLVAVASRLGRRPRVLMRLNPGVVVSTDARYRTSGADCKFGLSLPGGEAVRATRAALASEHLHVDGVHFHLGSQIMTPEPYAEAMAVTARFLAEVGGWAPTRVVVGGGMGVRYDAGPPAPTPGQWAASVAAAFRERLAPACASDVVLGIEPGRSVPAEHGTTLYTVGAVKRRPDRPGEAIAIVDGGLSDNPRPLMYSATHEVRSAAAPEAPATEVAHIYGRHCETDLLFADVKLPAPRRGDVLAVATTGAYVHCMASNYNRFVRPAVVFAHGGQSTLVVRRETPDDLLRTEQEVR
jgi:diaminopimelate decarboxylase